MDGRELRETLNVVKDDVEISPGDSIVPIFELWLAWPLVPTSVPVPRLAKPLGALNGPVTLVLCVFALESGGLTKVLDAVLLDFRDTAIERLTELTKVVLLLEEAICMLERPVPVESVLENPLEE